MSFIAGPGERGDGFLARIVGGSGRDGRRVNGASRRGRRLRGRPRGGSARRRAGGSRAGADPAGESRGGKPPAWSTWSVAKPAGRGTDGRAHFHARPGACQGGRNAASAGRVDLTRHYRVRRS